MSTTAAFVSFFFSLHSRINIGPRQAYSRVDQKQEKMAEPDPVEKDNCAICFDTMDEATQEIDELACKHKFHLACSNEARKYSRRCPLCRQYRDDNRPNEQSINQRLVQNVAARWSFDDESNNYWAHVEPYYRGNYLYSYPEIQQQQERVPESVNENYIDIWAREAHHRENFRAGENMVVADSDSDEEKEAVNNARDVDLEAAILRIPPPELEIPQYVRMDLERWAVYMHRTGPLVNFRATATGRWLASTIMAFFLIDVTSIDAIVPNMGGGFQFTLNGMHTVTMYHVDEQPHGRRIDSDSD